MGQNILHCIVWKDTKESEHLSPIPKPHLSTSLRDNKLAITLMISHLHFSFANDIKIKSCGMLADKTTIYQKSNNVDVSAFKDTQL